ncbi:putative quinol monooxygenase [Marixanthomonas spongiae]|uniref:Antibiotic biosynthesis monooxygenase n=1 Tax=Marixanthomonas spongiae TaxID=2174845 RepID=A0A2U0HU16_9FLAO|nr:antibiotic biosynthesis monooxygenase family protein [Marixanthomonas spongiae]PVW12335.1 antibiotic biosynthesis monooxygenase [Marixanthomonas spongiae]
MFTRIVKMEFKAKEVSSFLANFETIKDKIRSFPGCEFLELYRDKHNQTIFFTYSRWKDEAALEAYRHSDLFKGVWAKTKPKFKEKAAAWSVDTLYSLG